MLSGSDVVVQGGQGGQLQVNLPQASSEMRVDILDSNGKMVGQKIFRDLGAGKQIVTLDQLSVPDGSYSYKLSALRGSGVGYYSPESAVSGLVTGFIPGPDPKLVIGNREVSVGVVKEVTLPPRV
jgi:flagellar hook assembly protein FlgD